MKTELKQLKQYNNPNFYNANLEGNILGSMIESVSCRNLCFSRITIEDFYSPVNQKLFECILDLNKNNEEINYFTVERYTKISADDKSELYLSQYISDITNSAMMVNVLPKNLDMLQELTTRRIIKAIAVELSECIEDFEQDVNALADKANQQINQVMIRDFRTTYEHIAKTKDEIKERFSLTYDAMVNNKIIENPDVVKTNISSLDEFTGGGLPKTELVTIAGRPGMGKTAICISISYSMSKNLPVLFISLEMNKRELVTRIVTSECQIDSMSFKNALISESKFLAVKKSMDKLNNSNLFIDDCDSITLNEIDNKIRDFIASQGVLNPVTGKKDIGGVFIDHIGLISVPNKENTLDQIKEVTRSLKSFAKKYNISIVEVSKVSRNCESRQDKRPILSDLADSSSVEFDSSIVIFPFRPEYYDPKTERTKIVEMNFSKFRNGAVGKIDMFFDAPTSKFGSLERDF